jgi:hypothetical protein
MLRLQQSWAESKAQWDEYFKKNKQLVRTLGYRDRVIKELKRERSQA